MEPENLDIERINEDRRKAVEQSIQVISMGDLKSLGEELFPTLDHPWRQLFFEFIEEHASDTVYHGKSDDGFEVIYCPGRIDSLLRQPEAFRVHLLDPWKRSGCDRPS